MKCAIKTKEYIIGLIIVIIALCIHAQFSFCQSDESNYLAMTYRLYQGDKLIIEEWHPTQFLHACPAAFFCFIRISCAILKWDYSVLSGYQCSVCRSSQFVMVFAFQRKVWVLSFSFDCVYAPVVLPREYQWTKLLQPVSEICNSLLYTLGFQRKPKRSKIKIPLRDVDCVCGFVHAVVGNSRCGWIHNLPAEQERR